MITWTHRTVDAHGRLLNALDDLPWIRRRIILDLHARWYHDSGVEAHPTQLGTTGTGYTVRTPHCLQGDRTLSTLEAVDSVLSGAAGDWDWERFRTEVMARSGCSTWATRRHLGCFHRRGLARFDWCFALATEIAHRVDDRAARIHTVTDSSQLPSALTWWWPEHGWSLPAGKAPRMLTVVRDGHVVAALRTDGTAAAPGGPLDLVTAWRHGRSLPTIAAWLVNQP